MEIFSKKDDQLIASPEAESSKGMQRRQFLRYAGVGAAAAGLFAAEACKKDIGSYTGVYLGSGDIGILNYAYALEQLEAAFYTQVVATPYTGISDMEKSYLTDIRDHEVAHREFFKAALSTNAIPALQVNFSSINFTSRDSVLATAKAFEDLGVSAYNGAGYLIKSADYLTLAGKIVSVEARHAALIRDLISNGTFVTDEIVSPTTGLETSRSPQQVLSIASTYVTTKINADDLPTS